MKKLLIFVALLMIALPIAGAFGVIHDQVSFTVSNEYFTKFKFEQFRMLDPSVPERLRVAAIGFLASWWMGIPIGLLVAPVALIHRSAPDMFRFGLRSYLVLVTFTGMFALAGLMYGFYATRSLDLREYWAWYIPQGLVHVRRFICTGYMHNSAYLGGLIGIPVAWTYHVIARVRKPNQPPEPTAMSVTPPAAQESRQP